MNRMEPGEVRDQVNESFVCLIYKSCTILTPAALFLTGAIAIAATLLQLYDVALLMRFARFLPQ